jgi:Tol biopolymer transport system component
MRTKDPFVLTLVVIIGFTAAVQSTNSQSSRIASASTRASLSGAGNSHSPVFSADGRHIAFVSHANNLVTNDDLGPHLDLFVRDLVTSNTVLVSLSTNGFGGANDNVALYTLSSNAQFVAFETAANNLAPGDTNRVSDIYFRDLLTGVTRLVSVNADGSGSGNGPSSNPLISEDGRYIVFESLASNLVTNDFNGTNDIFIRDLTTGTTTLVSVNADGTASPDGLSHSPSISANGLFVAFASRATNLVIGVTNLLDEIYVRDVADRTNLWAQASHLSGTHSRSPASGALEPYQASGPVLSADGRYVVFKTLGQTVRFDLQRATNSTLLLFTNDAPPSPYLSSFRFDDNPRLALSASGPPLAFTADGRYLAYSSKSNAVPYSGVVLVDFESLVTNWVFNPPPGGTSGGFPYFSTNVVPPDQIVVTNFVSGSSATWTRLPWLGLNNNASRLFFLVDGTNSVLSPIDRPSQLYGLDLPNQLYALDLPNGPARLITFNRDGLPGPNLGNIVPALTPDGLLLSWDSPDDNIVADDFNRAWDVFVRNMDTVETELISARHASLIETSDRTIASLSRQAISANGHFIAYTAVDLERETSATPFDWSARNLIVRNLESDSNVFVGPGWPVRINTVTGETNYFSRPTSYAENVAVSADGRFVVFSRSAGSLGSNVFRADMQSRTITLVAEKADGGFGGRAMSPAISSDGRLVAFMAVGETPNPLLYTTPPIYRGTFEPDIIMRNLEANGLSNRVVTVNLAGTATGNNASIQPSFSPDGRWLTFLSRATDLVFGSFAGNTFQLFAHNTERFETRLVSFRINTSTNVEPLSGNAANPVFSADSRYIAFESSPNLVYRHDLFAGFPSPTNALSLTNDLICFGCGNPILGADGRYVAYQTRRPTNVANDVFVKDLNTGQEELISVNLSGSGGGNDSSSTPLISYDARFVVFASKASDLVPGDNNRVTDIFARDRLNGVTHCLSRNFAGTGTGNRVSSNPIMSADGRTVAFQSFASDLVPGDYNDTRDVFVVTLGGPDTDGDHMDDDWEMAYFNTLDRDGSGDFDHDGASDLAEFRAGTNPANDASILRVLRLTTAVDQAVTGRRSTVLLWSATPGRTYRVQFKSDLNFQWLAVAGDVTASSTSASLTDTVEATPDDVMRPHRFYRVLLVQ